MVEISLSGYNPDLSKGMVAPDDLDQIGLSEDEKNMALGFAIDMAKTDTVDSNGLISIVQALFIEYLIEHKKIQTQLEYSISNQRGPSAQYRKQWNGGEFQEVLKALRNENPELELRKRFAESMQIIFPENQTVN